MEADVIVKSPEEACGFVAGEGNQSKLIIPITNMLHDAFRFRMDPEEELNGFITAEGKGLDILAVYHSHPTGLDRPSPTDLDQLTFPGIIYLIWYRNASDWSCRGYLMEVGSDGIEIPVIITAD